MDAKFRVDQDFRIISDFKVRLEDSFFPINSYLPLGFQWGMLILATANTQFSQEMGLVMKPRMHSADSIPIVLTSVCFPLLKLYTGILKILEFEYKTDMF